MVKLMSYDLEVKGSSSENILLQSRVRLHTISIPGTLHGGSFVHRAILFLCSKQAKWMIIIVFEFIFTHLGAYKCMLSVGMTLKHHSRDQNSGMTQDFKPWRLYLILNIDESANMFFCFKNL